MSELGDKPRLVIGQWKVGQDGAGRPVHSLYTESWRVASVILGIGPCPWHWSVTPPDGSHAQDRAGDEHEARRCAERELSNWYTLVRLGANLEAERQMDSVNHRIPRDLVPMPSAPTVEQLRDRWRKA